MVKWHVTVAVLVIAFSSHGITAGAGDMEWERSLPVGFSLGYGEIKSVAIEGDALFLAGPSLSHSGLQVVALDLRTGDDLWSHTVDRTVLEDLAASGGRLFAAGWSLVRSYDAHTGEILWEQPGNFANRVVASNGRVFVAGFDLLRVHDAQTGTMVWEEQIAGYVDGLAEDAGTVFVCGTTAAFTYYAQAFDARTGRPLWEQHATLPFPSGRAWSLAARGNRVYVAGALWDESTLIGTTLLRAYDARTGSVLWEDRAEDRPAYGSFSPTALAVAEGLVFVQGASTRPWVRAHDAGTGRLVWEFEDPIPADPVGGYSFGHAAGLVVENGRLIAVEKVTDPASPHRLSDAVLALDSRTGALEWRDWIVDVGNPAPRLVTHGGTAITVSWVFGPFDVVRAYRVR